MSELPALLLAISETPSPDSAVAVLSRDALADLGYLVASVLFIFGIKGMTHPRTAVRGNLIGAIGMLVAVVVTLIKTDVSPAIWLGGMAVGTALGAWMAVRVQMTQMPQLVALFNGFGGMASLLVGWAALVPGSSTFTLVTIILKGSLSIHMKDPGTPDMRYTLLLKHDPDPGNKGFGLAAALTLPGTFIQHDNSQGREPAQVLYLTSPAFVFEPGPTPESMPSYDDAIVVGKDWARLAQEGWQPAELNDPSHSYAARRRAMNRLARKSYCRS